MDIDYQTLRALVDGSELEDWTELKFEGLTILVAYDDENSGQPAEYHHFDSHYEIYLWASISPIFRKPIVLHEVAELTLSEKYQRNGMSSEEAQLQAHNRARELDEIYAREIFDNPTFDKYLEMRKELVDRFRGD
ncbi:MAG: hypothetical protein AABW49_02020 [Nanoarchaeota archaeon]